MFAVVYVNPFDEWKMGNSKGETAVQIPSETV